MKQSVRISPAPLNNRLGATLLDVLSLFGITIILYFIILYGIFATGFHYMENQSQIEKIEDRYTLNLSSTLSYEEYETIIQKFYFVEFEEEIKTYINNYYGTDYSIVHIYNFSILHLATKPTFDSYKTDYYQYVQNEDGTFNVDVLAIKVEGNGKVYEQNMHDLFYNSYVKLKDLLLMFDDDYSNLVTTNRLYEMISRTLGFIISFSILYLAIPLSNTHGATMWEKFFKIAHINKKNGYLTSKFRIILRPIIFLLIPFIGIIIGSDTSIIVFTIGFIFLNFLLMLLSRNNKDIPDKLLAMYSASVYESLLFKDAKSEKEFLDSPEGQQILDSEHLAKLNEINAIDLHQTDNK